MKINKFAYIAVGAIFTLIVSFSWITWADTSSKNQSTGAADTASSASGDQSSASVEGQVSFLDRDSGKIAVFDGKQKHEFQTDAATQVMLDEKKADINQLNLGDEVQVFSNSEGQVRYIIVHRGTRQQQAVQPSAKAEQAQVKTAEPSRNNESLPLDELKVSLHQGNIEVKLEWENDKAEVKVKKPGGSFEIKGEEAAAYIQKWYSNLNLEDENDSAEVIGSIAGSFFLDMKKPFSADIEWKQNGKKGKWKVEPKDRGKHKGKDKKKHDDDEKEDHGEDD